MSLSTTKTKYNIPSLEEDSSIKERSEQNYRLQKSVYSGDWKNISDALDEGADPFVGLNAAIDSENFDYVLYFIDNFTFSQDQINKSIRLAAQIGNAELASFIDNISS